MPKIEIEVSDEVYRIAKIHSTLAKKPLNQAILEVVSILEKEKASPKSLPVTVQTKTTQRRPRRTIQQFQADLAVVIQFIEHKIQKENSVFWPDVRKFIIKRFKFTRNMADYMIMTIHKKGLFKTTLEESIRTNYFTGKK